MVLTFVFSLHLCPQSAVKNELKQISITIVEFPDDVRLILFFDVCLEFQVTVLSKLNFKKNVYVKSIDVQEKKVFTSWI